MNEYLKDNLILGDSLEIFFAEICYPQYAEWDFKNWCTLVNIRENLEVGTSQKSKFSKFDLTL